MTSYEPPGGRWYPPPPSQQRPRRYPKALPWVIAAGLALVGAVVAVAIISSRDDDAASSASDAAETPAPDDLVVGADDSESPAADDIEVTGCGSGVGNPAAVELDLEFVGAEGTLTNQTDETIGYYFTVEFVDADGTPYGEGHGTATTVAPDQTVEWTAAGFVEARPGTECRVTEAERFRP